MERLIINCDLGEDESPELTAALMARVDAVNICCGVHAGSLARTEACLLQAQAAGCRILAHPGLAMAGGRGGTPPTVTEFQSILEQQVIFFLATAARYSVPVHGIKLHGTLYHLVEQSAEHLTAYIDFVRQNCPDLVLSAFAGGRCLERARSSGLSVMAEIFFDRAYTAQGTLLSRSESGAVLEPQPAWERFQHWQQTQQMRAQCGAHFSLTAQTICIHGDSPDALAMLDLLRMRSSL
jgi:UPF0271 protein